VRRFGVLAESLHGVGYYGPEIRVFDDVGVHGWWRAYFAYRSAPLGAVGPKVVAAVFYGFAERMVARALPEVWSRVSPEEAIRLRSGAVDAAWRRIFAGQVGDRVFEATVEEAAELAEVALTGVDVGARPLAAAYLALGRPAVPHLRLWHAATVVREHRGDGHAIALAAAGVDPVECQVLMVARGHGNLATMQRIRGWEPAELAAATDRLVARGWVDAAGGCTAAGAEGREAVEVHTDRLAAGPVERLGAGGVARFEELVAPLRAVLHGAGGIPERWPPPHVVVGGADAGRDGDGTVGS